jgi:FKBP-type peptidyl-prolyl cis-trans isomerase
MESLIKKMPIGSKWEIYWPAKLVYGENGIPGLIPPDGVVVWELEINELAILEQP